MAISENTKSFIKQMYSKDQQAAESLMKKFNTNHAEVFGTHAPAQVQQNNDSGIIDSESALMAEIAKLKNLENQPGYVSASEDNSALLEEARKYRLKGQTTRVSYA